MPPMTRLPPRHEGQWPLGPVDDGIPPNAGQAEPQQSAELDQRIHLGGKVEIAVFVLTGVKRNDPDGISGNQKVVLALVVQGKGKNAAEIVEKLRPPAFVGGNDRLAVGCGLELLVCQLAAQGLVVADFAVDGQDHGALDVRQGLGSMLHVHDREALVGDDGVFVRVDAAPIGTPVSEQARHGPPRSPRAMGSLWMSRTPAIPHMKRLPIYLCWPQVVPEP